MDSDSVDDYPVRDTGAGRSAYDDKVSEQKRSQQRRAVAKISREELEDQYLRLHDENLILKRHARKQEEKIKKMATKLLRLVQDNKKKDGETGAGGTGARRKGGRDIETDELIQEQQQRIRDVEKHCEAYKKKLMVAKQQLATQSQRRTPYNHVQSRINTGMPKPPGDGVQRNLRVQGNRAGSATPRSIRNDVLPRYGHSLLEEARAENERLNEEIDNLHENCQILDQEKEILMEQIRIKELDHEEVLLRLKEQMSAGQRHTAKSNIQENVDMIKLQREVKEKSQKLAALEAQYATLQENLHTVKTSHDAVIAEMEDLNRKLHQSQAKSLTLQTELKQGSNLQRNISELQERITDTENEKDILREANEKLLNSAFDAERERQYRANEKQLKLQIAQLEATLKGDLNDKNTLLDKLNEEREEYEKLQKENRDMQVKYYAVRKQLEELQEKMKFFTKESAVDWNEMEEALILVKKRKERGTQDLDFLEKVDDEINRDMKIQMGGLQAEHADTVNELEKTRNMLLLQNKINRDYKQEVDSSTRRLEDYKQEYETKLDEYAQLLDIRAARIKKLERQMKDVAYGTKQFKMADIAPDEGDYEEVDESIKLERGQNLMEIHIEKISFSKEGLRELGDNEPATFATYEFFEFELQSTPVVKGDKPVFKFTSQYRVTVDDFFLHHLMKGATTLEVHQAIGTEFRTIAACQLKFRDLLDKPQGRIHGSAQLVGVESGRTDVIYGTVEFWVRLRVPMDQALRLFRERVKALGYMASNQRNTQQALSNLKQTGEEPPTRDRDENINELTVKVIRCSDVKARREGIQPNPYIIYRFFDFNDHDTTTVRSSNTPEINDMQTYPVPVTPDLDRYLRTETLDFYVFDDTDPEDTAYLGVAKVPLISLVNNKPMKGTFELRNNEGANGTIDVMIRWQYTYMAPKVIHTPQKPPVPSSSTAPKPPTTRPLSAKAPVPMGRSPKPPSAPPTAPPTGPPSMPPSGPPQPKERIARPSPAPRGLDMTPTRDKPPLKPVASSTPSSSAPERRNSRDRLNNTGPFLPQVQEAKKKGPKKIPATEEEKEISLTPPVISVTPPTPQKGEKETKQERANQRRRSSITKPQEAEQREDETALEVPEVEEGDSVDDLEREIAGEMERQEKEEQEEEKFGAETPAAADEEDDDNDLVAQELQKEFNEDTTQIGKTEMYEDTMFGDAAAPDEENDFDESSIEEDVDIPEPDDDEEEEEEGEPGVAKNESIISSDSESVIMPSTPSRPVSVMANEDTIIINIAQLTIDQDAALITDDSLHRLFIEYQFLGIAQEELETPFSLPKPGPNGPFELSYNFHKVIHIDGDMTKRNYLADFLRPDHSEQGRLRFTVVSEPPDEFQEDGDCIEVGYAYVDLRALLEEGRDLTDTDIEVVNVHDESQPVGSLGVTVWCVAALRAIQREVEASRAEEEEGQDIDTDEEA
ncbi:protein fantom isoform X2 [Strongylocentrotus purpuratus]|uniref:C2 domain-containing protein n=1 Tax=Strongylocentrotus purpuratus TaxID=7668 RepID=A0A7M7SUH0_STRPU|nr:protein fantom isoform X1 [Strongylocentrotus purpuratus]XP_030832104.1 protein fantom isoform X2 [Strongylocentrotus purpuratus]